MDLIAIVRTCPACKKTRTIRVNSRAYIAWQNGTLIQEAFPNLTPAEREELITGYHGACFDAAFASEEDSERLWDAWEDGSIVGMTVNIRNHDRIVDERGGDPGSIKLTAPIDGVFWWNIEEPGTVLVTGSNVE